MACVERQHPDHLTPDARRGVHQNAGIFRDHIAKTLSFAGTLGSSVFYVP